MSLISGTKGTSDVVFVADTLGYDGNKSGYCKYKFAKLATINNDKWLLAIAGVDIGKTLHEGVLSRGFAFDETNLFKSVYDYSDAMKSLYEESGYHGDCWFLLGGVETGNVPFLFMWQIVGGEWGLAQPCHQERVAIGAGEHGALYFITAYHDRNLPLPMRILTAYFSVSEAAKQDPRVGHPVDIGIASKTGARILNEKEIAPIAAASKRMAEQIGAMLKNESQTIEAPLTQQEGT